jgi:hypothetical protein
MKYQIEHDGTEVKLWFQSETIGKTLQECLEQVTTLGLKYNEKEVEELIKQEKINGSWTELNPPTYSAEDWIQEQGFTSLQIQALTRLEANILNSGKALGSIMIAVKSWLEGIMFESALNPESKSNWPVAPATYIQASQEAAQTLSS